MLLRKKPIRICDHGSASHREDTLIENYPFYAVIDAFSEPHSPKMPQSLFGKSTGGEIICETVNQGLSSANSEYNLDAVIIDISLSICDKFLKKEMPINDAGRIPGASFIFAKIEKEKINPTDPRRRLSRFLAS